MRHQARDVRGHGRQDLVDVGRVKRRAGVEAHRVAVPREHPVDEMRGALRHAPSATARTESSPVAAKGHQAVEPTPRASEPGEAPTKRATAQKVTKLLLHEAGEALSVAQFDRLNSKRLEVVAHDLVEDP